MDDELFKDGETRRHLQLASGLFLDIDFQHYAIGGGAGLLLYLQIFLEIAESLDTVARTLDLEAVERITFGKAELAPHHLVLGTRVAVDVHPLPIARKRGGWGKSV